MSQNLAMLTLFNRTRYFHEAASSSIVVAINTGTPLIVESGFSEVYTFVGPAGIVVAEDGDYAGALAKILHMTPEQLGDLAMEVSSRACCVQVHTET